MAALKENINWPCKGDFEVPKEVYDHYKELADNMAKAEDKWNELFAAYVEKYPEMKELWDNYFDGYDMSDLFNWFMCWSIFSDTNAVVCEYISKRKLHKC